MVRNAPAKGATREGLKVRPLRYPQLGVYPKGEEAIWKVAGPQGLAGSTPVYSASAVFLIAIEVWDKVIMAPPQHFSTCSVVETLPSSKRLYRGSSPLR